MLAEPLKSLGKKGKTLKSARASSKRKKARKYEKARKSRLGKEPAENHRLSLARSGLSRYATPLQQRGENRQNDSAGYRRGNALIEWNR